ncbi:hypothetical protein SRHO_G00112360 [Serrasalmus rhombeus]
MHNVMQEFDSSIRKLESDSATVIDVYSVMKMRNQLNARTWRRRSRRQNIHIIGIRENEEQGRPTEFVSMLIPKVLGEDNFTSTVKVDWAPMSLRPATASNPRPLIARLILPLEYNGGRVFIFPDFSPDIIKKRQALDAIKKKCKESGYS